MANVLEALFYIIFWALVGYMIYYCCCAPKKKDRGVIITDVQAVPAQTSHTVIGPNGNVTTTVSASTAYVASHPPYPIQQGPYNASYPVHGAVPGYPPAPYPTVQPPYPVGGGPSMPQPYHAAGPSMPQPYQGVPGAVPPYPSANPPPYDQVVSHEAYQKQAPYNPHVGGN